jgi:hypothetical protein
MMKVKLCQQGEVMNKSYLTIVLSLTCLFALAMSASAQDAGRVVVKVPFEFVVGTKTMPAGTYNIGRVSNDLDSGLVVRSYDNSVVVLPMVSKGESAEHAHLEFDRVGNKYFLSKVETPAGVYTIETPQAMTKVAQMNDHRTVSSSGAN